MRRMALAMHASIAVVLHDMPLTERHNPVSGAVGETDNNALAVCRWSCDDLFELSMVGWDMLMAACVCLKHAKFN